MNRSLAVRALWSCAVAALLAGCAVGPDYHAPPAAVLGTPAHYQQPASTAEPEDLSEWWRGFNDPELTGLIARATASNLDIAQSLARLAQAREARIQAFAAGLPTLTGSLGVTSTYSQGGGVKVGGIDIPASSSIFTNGSVGLDASWQADLFGGLRRARQAAQASEAAAGFDLEGVRTSVAAEVATNYVTARLAQARVAIAQDTLRDQDDNLQIAAWRVQAGVASSIDAEQARAQRAQTAASIPQLESAYVAALNRLCVLTGQAPGALTAEMAAAASLPSGPDAIAVGIPTDTLRRRPDVRSAERQLAAATARIGVAKAALYPALSLTGSISSNPTRFTNIEDLATGVLFAGLNQTIFDAGNRQSQVRSARAGADQALASYKSTVLGGLEEVENALKSVDAAKRRQAELTTAVNASETAATYARSQYRTGLIDFLTLLQSEQTLLSTRDALASAEADQALATIKLYLALGGGWRPAALPPTGRSS